MPTLKRKDIVLAEKSDSALVPLTDLDMDYYIPAEIKIGGHYFVVGYSHSMINRITGDMMIDGMCDLKNHEIVLRPGMNVNQTYSTIIHEVIEAINGLYELELEHRDITTLSETLYQVLTDNDLMNLPEETEKDVYEA